MMKGISVGLCLAAHASAIKINTESVESLVGRSFETVYGAFNKTFPHEEFGQFLGTFETTLDGLHKTRLMNGPNCDSAAVSDGARQASQARTVAAYPGGVALPLIGMDAGAKMIRQFETARGPAAAQAAPAAIMQKAALDQAKGVLQTAVAIAATDSTVGANAACVPMVTGHNCFGAVLYPITFGDSIMADVSDSKLNGDIANFPALYRSRVGVTDDSTYANCFSAYMSMKCASTFPSCTSLNAGERNAPGGRAPMCALHCMGTLAACPGMWASDISDDCADVSLPPMCAFATYVKRPLPQLTTFDESTGSPSECP